MEESKLCATYFTARTVICLKIKILKCVLKIEVREQLMYS